MSTEHKIPVSKLDAAKRQLETAIRLYFAHGDPVSIHTLTAAAYNIVRDVNKRRGGPPLFAKDRFMEYVKEGHEKEVWKRLNAAENFFKHADQDHNATFEFKPQLSELLILDGCGTYYKLTGEYPPLFHVFTTWYVAHNEGLFVLPTEQKAAMAISAPEIRRLDRTQYFAAMLPVAMRPHA